MAFRRFRWLGLAVAATFVCLNVPTSSQGVTLRTWVDTKRDLNHTWWPAARVDGDAATIAQIDRIEIYAYRDGRRDERPYFYLGGGTPSDIDDYDGNASTAAKGFSLPNKATPPVGYYALEARARNASTNTWYVTTSQAGGAGTPSTFVFDGKTDFVGNINPDLVLLDRTAGWAKAWNMSGHRVAAEAYYTRDGLPVGIPDGWTIVGTGDWRQELRLPPAISIPGGPDLLLQHPGGWLWLWATSRHTTDGAAMKIETTMMLEPAHLGDARWRVEATADMNRDTWPDLIVRHTGTGDWRIHYMQYNRITSTATPDPDRLQDTNWKIVGAADMNHDMWPDVIWQHQTEGTLMALLMNGSNMISSDYLDPWRMSDVDWKVRTVVDLNNDTWPDLVWQHAGNNYSQIWFMRGLRLIDSQWLSAGGYGAQVPYGWEIVGPK